MFSGLQMFKQANKGLLSAFSLTNANTPAFAFASRKPKLNPSIYYTQYKSTINTNTVTISPDTTTIVTEITKKITKWTPAKGNKAIVPVTLKDSKK